MKRTILEFRDICIKVTLLLSNVGFYPARQDMNNDNGNYDFLFQYLHFAVDIFDSGSIVLIFCVGDRTEAWELKWEDAAKIPEIVVDILSRV